MTGAMQEPTFWILTALVAEEHHGYGVIRAAESLSSGKVKLQAGTLYAALDRLVHQGLVEVAREETVNGRMRRYYRLTDRGGEALAAESARLSLNASTAIRLLSARQHGSGHGPAAVACG